MDAMLKIVGPDMKDAAGPISEAIVNIIKACGDQKTARHALDAFARTVKIENITISGSNFDNRTVNIDPFGASNINEA